MSTTQLNELEARARQLRRHIITMTTAAGSGHPTSSLSCVEILTALYFGGIMKFDPQNPTDPGRDRFIMSKGHAAPALYAAMAEAGYISPDDLNTLRKLGSPLEGHPNMRRLPGVEASTGSLGQGLSIGVGHALASKLDNLGFNVFVLLGDGENGEGQVWEAAMSGAKFKLDNLIAIVDRNKYQQTGPTSEVLDLTPLAEKWAAFGWETYDINGHDLSQVHETLTQALQNTGKPTAIIAQTQKGHGILPLLEELKDSNFHGKPLSKEHAEKALAMIGD